MFVNSEAIVPVLLITYAVMIIGLVVGILTLGWLYSKLASGQRHRRARSIAVVVITVAIVIGIASAVIP